jgi:hypothetical protein
MTTIIIIMIKSGDIFNRYLIAPFSPQQSPIFLIACSSIVLVLAKPAPEAPVSSYFPPSGGGGGVSGSYGPPADRYGPPQQNPVIHKHVYVHVPPPEAPEYKPPKQLPLPQPPQKHYKIVFIKAPTPPTPTAPQLPPLPQPDEEKTLIYVLVKKPEEAPDVVLPTQAPTQPSKPEVYFIRYKTQVTASVFSLFFLFLFSCSLSCFHQLAARDGLTPSSALHQHLR